MLRICVFFLVNKKIWVGEYWLCVLLWCMCEWMKKVVV